MLKSLTENQAEQVWAILAQECGASNLYWEKISFVNEFSKDVPASEWRFQGSLGFGGKFRFPRMSVDCYPEDLTPARREAIDKANSRLTEFKLSIQPSNPHE